MTTALTAVEMAAMTDEAMAEGIGMMIPEDGGRDPLGHHRAEAMAPATTGNPGRPPKQATTGTGRANKEREPQAPVLLCKPKLLKRMQSA